MADKKDPMELSRAQQASGFGGASLKEGAQASLNIRELAVEIAEQNKKAQDTKTDQERNQILMDLVLSTERGDDEGKENSLALRTQFVASQERLERAIQDGDNNAAQIERDNQSEILDNAETEENRREANKAVEKQSTLLGKISSGIGGLVGFAKDNAMAIGGGLLAGLAIFAPEVMEKLVKRVVEVLGKAFEIVKSLLDGDIDGALELFKGEWKAFTGAFIFFFGGTIVKTLKGVFKVFKILNKAVQTYRMFLATNYAGSMVGHFKDMMKNLGKTLMRPIKFLVNIAKAFKVFMLTTFVPGITQSLSGMMKNLGGKIMKTLKVLVGLSRVFSVFMLATFVPGMIAGFSGIIASITPILVALAPIIAIGAAIALVLYGLYEGFNEMRAVFEDTGSVGLAVTEGLSKLFATIVGFVPSLLKSALSWVAGKLGFDEAAKALDSFSITDFIQNGIANIFDGMRIIFMKAINGVIGIVNAALDWIPGFGAETIKPAFDIEKEEALIDEKNKKKEARQAEKLKGKEEEESERLRPNAIPLSDLAEDRLNAKQQLSEAEVAQPDLLDQQSAMLAPEFDAIEAAAARDLGPVEEKGMFGATPASDLGPVEEKGMFSNLFSALVPASSSAELGLTNIDNTIGDQIANDSANNQMLREELTANKNDKAPVVISQKGGNVTNNNTTNNTSRSYKRPRAWGSDEINSSYA